MTAAGVRRAVGAAVLVALLAAASASGRALAANANAQAASTDAGKAKAAAYLRAAMVALGAGDHATAVAFLEKAVEAAPGDQAVREGLAEAVRARAQSHGKADALTAAGHAALDSGAFDKAIGYFEKALEDWRDSATARATPSSSTTSLATTR